MSIQTLGAIRIKFSCSYWLWPSIGILYFSHLPDGPEIFRRYRFQVTGILSRSLQFSGTVSPSFCVLHQPPEGITQMDAIVTYRRWYYADQEYMSVLSLCFLPSVSSFSAVLIITNQMKNLEYFRYSSIELKKKKKEKR